MGYTTTFSGEFNLDKPLTLAQVNYLKAFASTRRMKRDALEAGKMADPVREAAGLPIGIQGGYFVGSSENFGQSHTPNILDYNAPPKGQPGLWCQWVPTDGGRTIEWDGGEKFYDYVEWLEYLIKNFLKPWGYKLSGEVTWQGEEPSDIGKIVVKNNKVTIKKAKIVFED